MSSSDNPGPNLNLGSNRVDIKANFGIPFGLLLGPGDRCSVGSPAPQKSSNLFSIFVASQTTCPVLSGDSIVRNNPLLILQITNAIMETVI